jgi:cardiolipin synthase A/B
MDWAEHLSGVWHYVVLVTTILLSLLASAHAVLYKRDTRAAVLWVGFIWLSPFFGAVLYFLFGVNRIRRRAVLLRGGQEHYQTGPKPEAVTVAELEEALPRDSRDLAMQARLVENAGVTRPLLRGNAIELLVNGDEAFPVLLDAIRKATSSITLSTYIFDRDKTGRQFAAALGDAVSRGVQVRVLIDDTGARYSWPTITSTLRRAKVPVKRFLPTFAPLRVMAMNLRNHRKILVVDGKLGFTGGMNIRSGNLLKENPSHPIQDIHFRVRGPVVAQLQEVFADDWFFTAGESLRGPIWFPQPEPAGSVMARGIADGPDEDFERLRWAILGALSCARVSVRIMTPYFLPDTALISALNLAAMRGVRVDIILPGRNNLPVVHWAACAMLWQMLERGCRVWFTPPPFDHSKLMIVDGVWSLIGSTNWDPRSLRLNFEFNVEAYDRGLAGELEQLVRRKLEHARLVTLEEMDSRSLPVKLRDGVARLLSPFM